MSDLIARLELLGDGAAAGDWADVVGRAARQHSRTVRRRLLVAIAVAALAVPTIAVGTRYWDAISLTKTEEDVPLPQGENTLGYVIGDRLQLPGRRQLRLGAPLMAAFVHPEAHLVVPSADRSRVVYHSWEGPRPAVRGPIGVPALRLFDTRTDRDRIIARNAQSPAWRADGVFAYTQALLTPEQLRQRRVAGPGLNRVFVAPDAGRAAVQWTRNGEWRTLAWAGRHLIVQGAVRKADPFVGGGYVTEYGLYAYSGPRRGRKLMLGDLIAVSPDGRFVFGRASRYGGQGSDSLMRLIEVESGRVVDEIRQTSGPGIWAGDTILMTTGFVSEPLPPGPHGVRILPGPDHVQVVVLHVANGKVTTERELRLSRDIVEATGIQAETFYFGFEPPAAVDRQGRQFTTKLTIENTKGTQIKTALLYLTCDRIEFRCRRGRSLDRSSSLVYNPSRPLPD